MEGWGCGRGLRAPMGLCLRERGTRAPLLCSPAQPRGGRRGEGAHADEHCPGGPGCVARLRALLRPHLPPLQVSPAARAALARALRRAARHRRHGAPSSASAQEGGQSGASGSRGRRPDPNAHARHAASAAGAHAGVAPGAAAPEHSEQRAGEGGPFRDGQQQEGPPQQHPDAEEHPEEERHRLMLLLRGMMELCLYPPPHSKGAPPQVRGTASRSTRAGYEGMHGCLRHLAGCKAQQAHPSPLHACACHATQPAAGASGGGARAHSGSGSSQATAGHSGGGPVLLPWSCSDEALLALLASRDPTGMVGGGGGGSTTLMWSCQLPKLLDSVLISLPGTLGCTRCVAWCDTLVPPQPALAHPSQHHASQV
jgi:hypothetical protein